MWKAVGAISQDFFNGASMYAWTHQHVFGHHTYTNIDGVDPDIYTPEAVSFHNINLYIINKDDWNKVENAQTR